MLTNRDGIVGDGVTADIDEGGGHAGRGQDASAEEKKFLEFRVASTDYSHGCHG